MSPTEIAEELGRSGLCICPDYLSSPGLRETRDDLKSVQQHGGFHRAGVGHESGHDVRDLIRRDEIHWLERETSGHKAQKDLWMGFDLLQQAFNRTLFLGLTEFEGHYASYAEGGYYRKHIDAFSDSSDKKSSRLVSIVLYLNEDWKAEDGGELRVHREDSYRDIPPIGGTLVCFMSREAEHEVLLSHAPRLSLAGWFGRTRLQIR